MADGIACRFFGGCWRYPIGPVIAASHTMTPMMARNRTTHEAWYDQIEVPFREGMHLHRRRSRRLEW